MSDDWGHFGKGDTGYAHYMQAFNESNGGSGGGGGNKSGCFTIFFYLFAIGFWVLFFLIFEKGIPFIISLFK